MICGQQALIFRRDPAQHAVRDDDIVLRQSGRVQRRQVGERALEERHIAQPGLRRPAPRRLDMCRVDVEAPHLRVRAGRGNEHRGHAVAAAQVGVAERPRQVRRALTQQQRGQRQPRRRGLAVDIARVGHVGDVAIGPLRHFALPGNGGLPRLLRRLALPDPLPNRQPYTPRPRPLEMLSQARVSSCAFSSAPSSTA